MSIKEERRRQTQAEAERVRKELDAWTDDRKARMERYQTQIDAISSEVSSALKRVSDEVKNDSLSRTTGEVLRDYVVHDQRLIWIRYAWDYFRLKFDQRLDDQLRTALTAADEVSWSCFHTFYKALGSPVPTAPVPYVEYDYVPSALKQNQSHILSRNQLPSEGPLAGYFDSLPVPLLRLPPGIVTAPWTLAVIGHEIGHLLQASVPGEKYPERFAEAVEGAAKASGVPDGEHAPWKQWAREVFADLCLVYACGPWAIWSVAPWVVTADEGMQAELDLYPPPVTRLNLLAAFFRALSVEKAFDAEMQSTIRALEVDAAVDRHGAAVQGVAALAKSELPTQPARSLAGLFEWSDARFGPEGRVSQWANDLVTLRNPVPAQDPTSARDASAAVVKAHFIASTEGDNRKRSDDLDAVRSKANPFLAAARAPGKRTGNPPVLKGTFLAERLFDGPPSNLF